MKFTNTHHQHLIGHWNWRAFQPSTSFLEMLLLLFCLGCILLGWLLVYDSMAAVLFNFFMWTVAPFQNVHFGQMGMILY